MDKSEIDKIVIVTLNELHSKDMLSEEPFDSDSEKILTKNEKLTEIIKKFESQIGDNHDDFLQNMEKAGFTNEDTVWIYVNLIISQTLARCEGFRRFLLSILNKKQKINGQQIENGDEYGKLIFKLLKILSYQNIQLLLDSKLRNCIGHDEWWFEGGILHFKNKDGAIQKFSYSEFMSEIKKLNQTIDTFVYRYLENYRKGGRTEHYAKQMTEDL